MPESLFIDAPLFEKVATVKLSSDATNWPLEIVQHLHEEHPYLAEAESAVVFKKQDKNRGYGYGFLKIGENIRVPLIVREWQMNALDVWLDDAGKTRALSEDAIKAATLGTTLGKTKKPQTDGYVDSLIYSRTYPPYDGKYVYASDNRLWEKQLKGREYVSILSAIPFTEQEKKACIAAISQAAMVGFNANNTKAVIQGWAQDSFEKVASEWEKKARGPMDMTSISMGIPDAIIKEDMSIGESVVIEKYGRYLCQGKSGATYEGHVFPNVYDFDLNPVGLTLFKGRWKPTDAERKKGGYSETVSAMQAKIAGQKMPKGEKIYDQNASGGDRGFFVMEKGDAAVALIPVNIITTSRTREHHETKKENEDYSKRIKIEVDYDICRYHCKTDLGEPVLITQSPNVKNVIHKDGEVLIPKAMKFCRLESPVMLKDSPESIKIANEADLGLNDLTVRHHQGVYGFQGSMVDDYELQAGVMEKEALEFLEKTWTKEASAKIIDSVKSHSNGRAGTIHISLPKEMNKTAEFHEEGVVLEKREEIAKKIQELTQDFDKIAATMQDSGLVDTVLSLKFLNAENVNKYAEFIPQFEDATGHLADLLVASRLGLQVQEHPIKVAMENISKVVSELKTIRGK